MPSDRGALHGLYAITPQTADTESLVARTRLCLDGGARLVQYRAKTLDPALALEQARRLAAQCRAAGALFIVNDSVDLALAIGADGVHLGRDDADPRHARSILPRAVIGVSCYAEPERARAAAAAGADYVAIGSMFPSSTKRSAARAPVEAIRLARQAGGLPVAAIGGISPSNAAGIVQAGADMVAVISALYDAPDVRGAAHLISRLFETNEGHPDVRAQSSAV